MEHSQNNRIKRLIYQSTHRGCKETDLLLGDFAVAHLANLSEQEVDLYEQFILENDWDIYAWLTGTSPLPPHYNVPFIKQIGN